MSAPFNSTPFGDQPPPSYLPPAGAFQPQGGAFSPPPGGAFYQPPPKSGAPAWVWVLVGLLGVGFLSVLAICGGLVYFGLSIESAELRQSLNQNPIVQEHLGTVKEVSLDMVRSTAEDDDEIFVYRVQGSKASGYITGVTEDNEQGQAEFISGELELDSGQKFDLHPH